MRFHLFEFALNSALKSDPETLEKLQRFDNRAIGITVEDFNTTLFAAIDTTQVLLSNTSHQTADLMISATTSHLLQLIHNPEHLFSTDIQIHGDVQFARQLQDLLQSFEFDWEAQIAKLTGETLAYPVSHLLRQTISWLSYSYQSLQHSSAEYLKEEVQILPDKSQVNLLMNEIDTLRADLDRLEARIHRLQS